MKDFTFNKEEIKKNINFYGLFIMVYEQFFNEFYNRIYNFFVDDSINITNNEIRMNKHFRYEKIKFTKDDIQDRQIQKLKDVFKLNNDKVISMYRWMNKYHLITKKEFDDLITIKKRRNEITHQLFDLVVVGGIKESDKELFNKLVEIRNNAFKNWIEYFEIIDDIKDLTFIPTLKIHNELVDRDNYIINVIKDIIEEKI